MAKAGQTYYILVSGAKVFEDAGTYNLEISVRIASTLGANQRS
jgi:hypothetical protein